MTVITRMAGFMRHLGGGDIVRIGLRRIKKFFLEDQQKMRVRKEILVVLSYVPAEASFLLGWSIASTFNIEY